MTDNVQKKYEERMSKRGKGSNWNNIQVPFRTFKNEVMHNNWRDRRYWKKTGPQLEQKNGLNIGRDE